MHNERAQADGQQGFSILELIIVVTVILVLVALAGKSMFDAVANYRLSSSARSVAATAQLAKIKATSRDARYQVEIDATNSVWRVRRCPRPTGGGNCTWELDPNTADQPLAPGVSFTTNGVSAPPPGMGGTVVQADNMTFNTRGLLVQNTNAPSASPIANQCVYLNRTSGGNRPFAVCSTMTGKTTVWRLNGSAWEMQ